MERIPQVQHLLKEKGIHAFLFSSHANVFYLSGFKSSHAYVVVGKDSYHFLTDGRYYERARSVLKDWDVMLIEGDPLKSIYKLIRKIGASRVGYEEDRVSCEFRKKLKGGIHWIGIPGFLKKLRAIKDKVEIDTVREGVRASDRVYYRLLGFLREGLTELELRSMIVSEFFKEGATGESFPTIVVSGEGSAIPHWETSNRRIRRGEALLIDMGLVWNGYCTDFTRTLHIGRASSEFKKIYNIVRDAHLLALEKVKVGRKISEIDKTAREFIKRKGFGKAFSHSTGHGVGIEIHEYPRVYYKGQDKDVLIEEGMVFTIEPGIYLKGKFGVRLENMVAVVGGVGEPLSQVSLDLVEI
ncbi:MAG: Xaa-Pro peptidase family protein [Aquificaceae bacterium]|nr:Xaa-Pro peptidase family protein [Aquificaceae bacterium]